MKTHVRLLPVLCLLVLTACGLVPAVWAADAPPLAARSYVDFDPGWKFTVGDFANASMPGFNDAAWQTVNVPHDWSSAGPFGPQYASGNGYAPGGIGWYRKRFTLPAAQKGKVVAIEFDGVYDNAEVWVNGQYVGGRPYGYSSFECDLTPYLDFGGGGNVIAVRVDHSRYGDSRWYTGSGIYRHVRLRVTDPLHIAQWGTYVTTPTVNPASAQVRVETMIQNASAGAQSYTLRTDVIGPDGGVVATQDSAGKLAGGGSGTRAQTVAVPHPALWAPDTPTLYAVRSRVLVGGAVRDDSVTPFGIRTLKYDPDKGFLINGVATKFKGVCLHHDAGSVGAAVPDGVLERRLRLLRALGVNAIRTSHNPPAPEMLATCDRLGFLVMEEAFDEWTPAKKKWVEGRNVGQPSKFGYAEDFADWSVRDTQDMVRRDRNHPSVVMWSIGNEIDYPNDPFSHPTLSSPFRYDPLAPDAAAMVPLARPLVAAIKPLDTTRPVTMALASLAQSNPVGLPALLDIVGYNYQEPLYPADHTRYPRRVIFGSETGHSYASWATVRDNAYVLGQFLWIGIDYLGEANGWPNRANGQGLLDLCGFEKPIGYFRQSLWSDAPMVALVATDGARPAGPGGETAGPPVRQSWNWPAGTPLTVSCYTNCQEVRLTLNGRDLGAKRLADAADGVLTWAVPYEAGTLQAVGLKDGRTVSEFALRTAGAPAHVALIPDTTTLSADGKSVCNLEYQIQDVDGVRVPDSALPVTFTVRGPARVLGIGNGDVNDPAPGTGLTHTAFQGRGLAVLQATTTPGDVTVTATAPGLAPSAVTLTSE